MNISELNKLFEDVGEVSTIGITREHKNHLCHLVGLTRHEQAMNLIILQYEPDAPQDESEALHTVSWPTNRQELRSHSCMEADGSLDSIESVTIDGEVYYTESCSTGYFYDSDWESIVTLSEFLRRGWEPGAFGEPEIDRILITKIKFDGEYDKLPKFSARPEILLEFSSNANRFLVEQPLSLVVGESLPDKQIISSSKGETESFFYIENVELLDPLKEMEKSFTNPRVLEHMTAEEAAQRFQETKQMMREVCPEGMCQIAVEYECEEDISLQFYLKEYLDAEPIHTSRSAFFMCSISSDKKTGSHGLPLKVGLIKTPVTPDTQRVEAELFEYIRFVTSPPLSF